MNKTCWIILVIFAILSLVKAPISAQETATEESNAIREKVKAKLEEAKSSPKAYLGTITDITEGTIQTKSLAGEIQQLSVSEEGTDFVKTGKTAQAVKLSDVALGDFIVAMGFLDGNSVLEAKRVLITSPIEPSARNVILGEITEIAKKTVTLNSKGQGEIKLEFPKTWKGPEISELNEGFQVIAVVEIEEDRQIVRTIQVVSEPQLSPPPEESEEE